MDNILQQPVLQQSQPILQQPAQQPSNPMFQQQPVLQQSQPILQQPLQQPSNPMFQQQALQQPVLQQSQPILQQPLLQQSQPILQQPSNPMFQQQPMQQPTFQQSQPMMQQPHQDQSTQQPNPMFQQQQSQPVLQQPMQDYQQYQQPMQQQDYQPGMGQQQQDNSNGMAKIHYLDGRNYDEIIGILIEFSGFVYGELQKPEPLDQTKLGAMLTAYIHNCLKKGPPAEEQAPTGATCQHLFIKGDKSGEICNKTAKFKGVDGLPKCSTHKTSKPSKASTSAPTTTGPAGQTFSYAAQAGRGKVTAQTLTTIQATIAEQATPSQIALERAPDGRLYNPQTNLVFEQRPDGLTAVGVMNGPSTTKLSVMDAHVCWGNQWKWDPNCVDDAAAKSAGHPLVVGEGHPLVSAGTGVMNQKIASIMNNTQ